MLENRIESRLKKTVESFGGICIKMTSPGNAGVPDRICIMPGGEVYFVELKRPNEVLRPLQRHWIKKINSLDAKAFWVSTFEEIEHEFKIRGWYQ